MNRSELLHALADRCTCAIEPDRQLDADIFLDTGEFSRRRMTTPQMLTREYVRRLAAVQGVPAFTSSMDAALSLIPPGLFWLVGHGRDVRPEEPLGGAVIFAPGALDTIFAETEAPTVALAICAAALRARVRAVSSS